MRVPATLACLSIRRRPWCLTAPAISPFESREYVIVNAMTYGALVRCSTGTASFEASAEKEHLARLLTAAGVAGWILSGNDAWYIAAAGVTGDVLATSTSTANAHAQAARRAMSQGIKSLNGTLKK